LPISLLITYYGFDFAYLAFEIGEKSGDPGGLYYRFGVKYQHNKLLDNIAIYTKDHSLKTYKLNYQTATTYSRLNEI
jgi:hypothetical protein